MASTLTNPELGSRDVGTKSGRRRRPFQKIMAGTVLLVIAWFVVTFLYYPNISILRVVLLPESGSVTEVFKELAASEKVTTSIRNTLIVAVISVVTASIVGIAQAFFLEAVEIKGRTFLTLGYAVPLVFSSVSAVSGYAMVYGSGGYLTRGMQVLIPALPDDWFSGMAAVIFVHTFTMTGYHFLFLRPALRRIDFSTVEAARSLGMGVFPALLKVVLPVLRPMILASMLMVFMGSVSSFAAPNILGGASFSMVAPLIMALTNLGRPDMAAIIGLALGLVTAALLMWALRAERRSSMFSGTKSARPLERIKIRNPMAKATVTASAYLLAVINLAPLVLTLFLALSPVDAIRRGEISLRLTLENFTQVFSTPAYNQPLLNSLQLCLIAIPLAVVIGTLVSHLVNRFRNRAGDVLQLSFFLPHFLPGVLVALGFITAFGVASPLLGNHVLVGSYWILPMAYVVILLPTIVRFVGAAYNGLDPAQDEAGRSLGAGAMTRFWRIGLPVLTPVLLQVMALSFNQTFDEYTISVMLYNVNNQPLGVALGALAAGQDPEMVGITTAYVVINTMVALIVVLFADRMAARASARAIGQKRKTK